MADKTTIVSLYPFELNEDKPGLYPGRFTIPAASAGDISILTIDRAVHHVYLDMDRGSLTVPTPSEEVARAICQDFISAQLAYSPGEAEPGLFFVEGSFTKKEVLDKFKDRISGAKERQRQWYVRLVEVADDEWAKYHSHKSISDLQRFAAVQLGLEREWNVQGTADAHQFCPACKMVMSADAMICGSCRTIVKPEEYKKAGFATAGV